MNNTLKKPISTFIFLFCALFFAMQNVAFSQENPPMKLKDKSKSKKYGFDEKNPIKVGTVRNQYVFLGALVDAKGEEFTTKREGSCCSFDTNSPTAFMGKGLLDVWKITYKNSKKVVTLYFNGYDFEEPKAPKGFTFKNKN